MKTTASYLTSPAEIRNTRVSVLPNLLLSPPKAKDGSSSDGSSDGGGSERNDEIDLLRCEESGAERKVLKELNLGSFDYGEFSSSPLS